MLYLSRLILNLRDRHVRQDLADVHQLHRTILNAFPAAPDPLQQKAREYFGILFRAEPMPDQLLTVRILVQSSHEPNWSHLPTGYLAPSSDERSNPAVRTIDDYDRIVAGTILRFRLRANPTKRISKYTSEQKDLTRRSKPATEQKDLTWIGRRVELRREEDQLKWIERKAEQGGFRLLSIATRPHLADVRVSPQANAIGYHRDDKNRTKMTFGAALFEGLLEVQDVDRFQQTLTAGIGSGKAYGFGLLSIATLN